jgi:hypothetical protein
MEKNSKSSKGFTKAYGDEGNMKIIIGIMDRAIKIIAKDEIEVYKGQIDLYTLQEKDRYFKMYDKIEDAYEDILTSFNKDKYELIKEENHLVVNIEIEVNFKKSIISIILDKKEIQSEDLTKSLYRLASKYIKENNGLKNEILELKDKINNMEEKLNFLYEHIKKKEGYSDTVFKKSKLFNEKQIEIIQNWISPKKYFKCKLIYDAKENGDKVSTYHSLCDNKGPTLTIFTTSNNLTLGGYLSVSFNENSGWIHDEKAFIFSLNPNEKYSSIDSTYTFYGGKDRGPTFGGYNIEIYDNFLSNERNKYNMSRVTFDFNKKHKNSKNHYFKVIDLQVYQIYD